MAVSHKGAISFGLVHIPVALHTATQDNDISFRQLCPDGSRVKYKRVCASCGKEIEYKDIIRGFEYEEDKYVTVSDEELEKIKTEKDKTIQIIHFTDLANIRPIYYDKTYHAVPETGGEKALELLRQAMLQENKVAIAKTVMSNSETVLCILPTSDGILVEKMFYQDEIKELPKEFAHPEVSEAELTMAKTLIASLERPFEPSAYKDEYQERLRKLIADKIAGKEIVVPPTEKQDNVIDLMDALKASIEQAKPAEKPKRGRPKKDKGA